MYEIILFSAGIVVVIVIAQPHFVVALPDQRLVFMYNLMCAILRLRSIRAPERQLKKQQI